MTPIKPPEIKSAIDLTAEATESVNGVLSTPLMMTLEADVKEALITYAQPLVDALRNIIDHQKMVCNTASHLSATTKIASNTLVKHKEVENEEAKN